MNSEIPLFYEPLTRQDIEKLIKQDNQITIRVQVDLGDLIDYDLEYLLDTFTDFFPGYQFTDISYELDSLADEYTVIMLISGFLESNDWDEDEELED